MTPDELRRMDNDLCIIYEKGIKPVKAKKFYYFKHPMAKEMKRFEISHNDIGEIDRGPWRKYNPYNPYVPEDEKKEKVDSLKVESLDDLFDDIPSKEDKKEESKPAVEQTNTNIKTENTKKQENKLDLNSFDEAPVLPQEPLNNEEDDDIYDLQKELEAKFDDYLDH